MNGRPATALLGLLAAYVRHTPFEKGRYRVRQIASRLMDRLDTRCLRSVVRTRHWLAMELDLGDWVARHIYLTGGFELGCTNLLRAILRPGDAFVDVGANIGYFTLLASVLVGRNGEVIAVEPNPGARARLERNVSLNRLTNVRVVEAALSDRAGELTLHLGPADNSGLSSFRVPRDSARSIAVAVRTLDSLVTLDARPRAIVKIDVEGAELQVLRGMRETLRRARPDLIVEISPQFLTELGSSVSELLDLLGAAGYTGYEIGELALSPFDRETICTLGQFNAFFTARRPWRREMRYQDIETESR